MSIPSTVLAKRMLIRVRMRHWHVFIKVAELGSVQRASAAVGLSQPSATHVLADLEDLLGSPLFQRHARGMRLTRHGLALLPFARRMLDVVHESADVVSAMQRSADSQVRLAAISSGIMGILSEVLPEFTRQHPDWLIQVQELDMEQIGLAISREDVDLVLCRQPEVVPGGWAFHALLDDEFVVVAGPQHPLARRKKIQLDSLWRETWLQGPTASAARRAFDHLVEQHGVQPPMRMLSTRSPSIFWSMMGQAPLVSLMPVTFARQMLRAGQICQLPVALNMPFDPLGVLFRTEEEGSAAVQSREYLIRQFSTTGPAGSTLRP